MKKAFDQTVRDLKREVKKKVLKVPGIEQKVLDATCNEPWGPHGSHLADIAQSTRNYNEYQLIMAVLWKRINDTGRNWRHVYKALTVLEYLVAHGSERVIDDIKEHAYQISTLSDFQYIDSGGRDQGSNVRKKSQSLVVLVNDKERILEVRQKAATNRDKYRGSSSGGMYRPRSHSSMGGGYGDRYDDDRYEGRDEDRNEYGREREWESRDDGRYGRSGDPYGRDSDEGYGKDGYRDDDYRGNRGSEEYGSRNRSSDRERDRSYDDDDRHSSRSGGGRADDLSPDERRFERKLSQQSMGGPPSYEEAVNGTPSHNNDDRDGGPPGPKASSPSAPKASSPSGTSPSAPKASSPPGSSPTSSVADGGTSTLSKEVGGFDEFDPRGSMPASSPVPDSGEMDIFGLSEINSLAIMPMSSVTTTSEPAVAAANPEYGPNFVPLSSASTVLNQLSEDPFGDAPPFKAFTGDDNLGIQPQSVSQMQFYATTPEASVPPQAAAGSSVESFSNYEFADTFQGITYAPPSSVPHSQSPSVTLPFSFSQGSPVGLAQSSDDILGGILPQTGPSAAAPPMNSPSAPSGPMGPVSSFGAMSQSYPPPSGHLGTIVPFGSSPQPGPTAQFAPPPPTGPGHFGAPVSPPPQALPQPAPSGQPGVAQQPKDKFDPKSTVWADTLSRGLVNLNISGPKINPLADIGIDFESINRQEKRREKEKSSSTAVTSTITMGKAMGSGSGFGRAGASALAPHPNPMMGSNMGMGMGMGGGGPGMGMGMGMGMGGGPGMGMGMGGGPGMGMGGGSGMGMGGVPGMGMGVGGFGGGMNQPMGGMGMSMGMGMGMGQGAQMRPSPGPGMPGGYNPMMGMGGGYGSQQPYGGYR